MVPAFIFWPFPAKREAILCDMSRSTSKTMKSRTRAEATRIFGSQQTRRYGNSFTRAASLITALER